MRRLRRGAGSPARPEPGRPAQPPQHGRLGDEPAAAGPRPGTGPPRQRSRADPGRPALSPRELEVLRLLADGASNPGIGKTLHISRRTAEHHVEHILAKLDVTSRAAALTRELLA
jgi:DNA-binding CsgD family transcriptional regulator